MKGVSAAAVGHDAAPLGGRLAEESDLLRPLGTGDAALHRVDGAVQRDEMAADGLRVMALARKQVGDKDAKPYENLVFIGLVWIADLISAGLRRAIA